jgi:hypothetical protein
MFLVEVALVTQGLVAFTVSVARNEPDAVVGVNVANAGFAF